jgi:predicted heme/steroid binding protein
MHHRSKRLTCLVVAALAVICLFALTSCGAQGSSGAVVTTGSGGAGTGSGGSTSTSAGGTATSAAGKTFTADELAAFDGQNGNAAYIAVDGTVYDVSDSSFWKDGKHSTCNLGAMAGKDLSELIKQAPARMRSDLQRMPVVGTLAQ